MITGMRALKQSAWQISLEADIQTTGLFWFAPHDFGLTIAMLQMFFQYTEVLNALGFQTVIL